eukprot:6443018-Pyramimonas_sp.AAC.1
MKISRWVSRPRIASGRSKVHFLIETAPSREDAARVRQRSSGRPWVLYHGLHVRITSAAASCEQTADSDSSASR